MRILLLYLLTSVPYPYSNEGDYHGQILSIARAKSSLFAATWTIFSHISSRNMSHRGIVLCIQRKNRLPFIIFWSQRSYSSKPRQTNFGDSLLVRLALRKRKLIITASRFDFVSRCIKCWNPYSWYLYTCTSRLIRIFFNYFIKMTFINLKNNQEIKRMWVSVKLINKRKRETNW